MAFANYLSSLDLDPAVAARLTQMAAPAPGDPGFAASVLGAPPESVPAGPPRPPGPAPGEPGFSFANVAPSAPAPPPPPPPNMPVMNIPKGAGTVDTSMVAPKGFSEGTAFMNVPKGAGQVDLSGVSPSGGPPPANDNGARMVGLPAQGPSYVPGGYALRKGSLDPAAFGDVNELYDKSAVSKLNSIEHLKQAATGQAAIDAAYFQAARDAHQQDQERQARIARERQDYVDREHEKLAALSAAAQTKVDPEAAKGSSGSQLLAAIGIALGQFGASLNGGTNTALQIVNANIDRNIRAQEANIANAHKALGNEQSLYKENLDAFGDQARASAATKMQMLDQAKLLADEQYAKGPKTEEAAARYEELLAGIQASRAIPAAKFAEDTAMGYQPGGFIGGVGGAGSAGTAEAKKDAHGYSQDLEKAGIPEALGQLQDLDSRLDTMGTGDVAGVGPIAGYVPNFLSSKEAVANRQAIAAAKNAARKITSGASLTPDEKAENAKAIDGANDAASLRNFVQSLRRQLVNKKNNIGAGYSPEGRALYEQRGGSVPDVSLNKSTTPYLRPVDGSRPDESSEKKPQYRTKR